MLHISASETIKNKMLSANNRAAGFDYLRIGLAAAVVAIHSVNTSYGAEAAKAMVWSGWNRPLTAIVLPMFFALSGFLVTGSLLRSKTLAEFLTLRAVRLVPALFVEVILAAFLLGPLLTIFPLREYFTDQKLFVYPLNIIGRIHFQLPGLFLSNPDPDMVNRQLWTIPVELECYLSIAILSVIGLVRRKFMMLFVLIIAIFGLFLLDVFRGTDVFAIDNVPSKVLEICFLIGILFYLFQDRIIINVYLFALALVGAYVCLYFKEMAYLACVPIVYITVYLGLTNPPRTIVNATGDYSYGLYLYGYPIQQSFVFLFPNHRIWWLNLIFTLVVGLLCAAFSWRVIESPALRTRHVVVGIVNSGVYRLKSLASRRLPVG